MVGGWEREEASKKTDPARACKGESGQSQAALHQKTQKLLHQQVEKEDERERITVIVRGVPGFWVQPYLYHFLLLQQ